MAMSNEEITNEFETLFGDETPEEEIDETPTDEEEIEEEDRSEEEEPEEEEEEPESEEEPEEEKETPEDKERARQNYAFAQQRQQIKQQEQFIKNLGKLIGMDGAKPEEIQDKVAEVLLEKQSKEQNIPIEILKRLEVAEAAVLENQSLKRESEVQDALTNLAEDHNLGDKEINEFTRYLIENNKNPLEHPEVDLAAEYLKLHYTEMIQAAVDEALGKEKDRKDKVKDKASSPTPDGKSAPEEDKINTIEDLDKLFNSMDI